MAITAARWEALWQWPLTVAALAFLAAYAWQVLGDLKGPAGTAATIILTVAWLMFAVDFVGWLILAERRWHWFVRHLLDLAIVVLPVFRPLRLVRLLVLLAIFNRFAGRTLHGRVASYVAGTTLMLVFVGSLATDAERREPGASIRSFGDAVWWACNTISTVGYGDVVPVTVTGRCIAVALMIAGIALLGTVTATLASWIVRRVAEEDESSQAATRRQGGRAHRPGEHAQVPGSRHTSTSPPSVSSLGGSRAIEPPLPCPSRQLSQRARNGRIDVGEKC
jgi:voltage-gated potassium channel